MTGSQNDPKSEVVTVQLEPHPPELVPSPRTSQDGEGSQAPADTQGREVDKSG